MKSPRRMEVLLSLLAIVWCFVPHASAQSCDGQWIGDFRAGDLDAEVYDIFQDGDHPIFAGLFRTAGDQRVNGVAKLVNGQWIAMGPDRIIAAYQLGRFEGDIVLNGVFATPAGNSQFGIARLRNGAWEMIGGSFTPSLIFAQAMIEFDGDLYVGGSYQIARWDGTTWSNLPSPGARVTGLSAHQQSLYVSVESYDFLGPGGVLRWTGTAWHTTNYPYESAAAIVEHGGVLYAGTSEQETDLIYALGTHGWEPVEGSYCQGSGSITSLVSAPDGLYVCGHSLNFSGAPNADIVRINGNEWHAFAQRPAYSVLDLGFDAGRPVVGGWLGLADRTRINNVAVWDGGSWSPIQPIGNGINGYPRAAIAYKGRLVVSGTNCGMGNLDLLGIASWKGNVWQSEGAIEPEPYHQIWPHCLATQNGILYSGGYFSIGTPPRLYPLMHRFNNVWAPVSASINGSASHLVTTRNGIVVTGNMWNVADGSNIDIALWDGAAWHPLGTAFGGSVWCACEFNEQLIVGGTFSAIDGVQAASVARLGRAGWESIGDVLPGSVNKLVVFEGRLYAATYYTNETNPQIYVLENDRWEPASEPDNGHVGDFAVYDGRLYFSCPGPYSWPNSPGSLRVLTTTGSEPVPGSPDDYANALTVYDDGNGPSLFAVGNFAFAGGRASSRIAQYTTCPCPADANGDDTVDGRDLSVFLARFSRRMDNPYEAPDFNGDREVDARDLSFLLSRFGKSCQ